MRKKEIKINDCKKYYNKLIVMIFVPNRFSQKLGRWQDIKLPENKYGKDKEAILVPFNFRAYNNNKTIIKRLKEFDYVLVHETDVDVIEKLKELKIDFRVLPNIVKKGCYKYSNQINYLSYINSEWYVEKYFKFLYDIEPKIATYYILKDEYTDPTIEEIHVEGGQLSWMYESKKEIYDYYVSRCRLEINNYSETLNGIKRRLNIFIDKYGKELGD